MHALSVVGSNKRYSYTSSLIVHLGKEEGVFPYQSTPPIGTLKDKHQVSFSRAQNAGLNIESRKYEARYTHTNTHTHLMKRTIDMPTS